MIDTYREYLSAKKRIVQLPNDLYLLSMQRFLILELDLDNSCTQSHAIANAGGMPWSAIILGKF